MGSDANDEDARPTVGRPPMDLQHCSLAHGDHDDGRCAWCGDPLPPRRSRWCQTSCATAWRDAHVWTFARKAALDREGYQCAVCASTDRIEVHHDPPVGRRGYAQGCAHHPEKLTVLCHDHHVEAEVARRAKPGTVTQLSIIAA